MKQDQKEMIYASNHKAPLGTSHDQGPGLPQGLDPTQVAFGLLTVRDGSASEMVSPNKSRDQVEQETQQGKHLYIKSHGSYEVGERVDRDYDWSWFTRDSVYGVPTPHDNDGIHVRSTLKWLHETESEKAAKLVTKRVDDFREKAQPQIGQVHDPIKDTLNVPDDHSFGILVRPDPYGAGDLIHNRIPKNYLRGRDHERGVVAAIRQHLKKANYHYFDGLHTAFKFYDKDSSGKIDENELREVCFQYNLPVDNDMLRLLIEWCDVDQDGQIDYTEFANFLNWKHHLPSEKELEEKLKQVMTDEVGEEKEDILSPPRLKKQIDESQGDYKTSSQMINAVVGGISTRDYQTYGVATIRSDLPAPTIRRVGDHTNYGDESDARGLVNPNIYSNVGVYEQDFFQARSQEQVKGIMEKIGVKMTPEVFQELWQRAAMNDPNGLVSVESFRATMEDCQSQSPRPVAQPLA
jgi:hypothetical protein